MPPGGVWDVWVDTGGTFTDCVARDPEGRIHVAKVLSSSALRANLRKALDARTLQLEGGREVLGRSLRGLELRALDDERFRARVVEGPDADGVVRVDQDLPDLPAGARVELRSGEEAPVLAARLITGAGPDEPLPPLRMRLATTRATNTLLERKGSPVLFFVTRGFADVLEIGDQRRPDLFALDVVKPPPLHARVVEVDERLASDGSVLRPLDERALLAAARAAVEDGFRVAAVSLLHAYRNDVHERRTRDLLLEAGFEHVSLSSMLAPAIHHLHRSETAVVNAYLSSALSAYVAAIDSAIRESGQESGLHLMTSAGGLVRRMDFHPKDSLLSGPAGGVLGAIAAGRLLGHTRVIAFDMGGTSTDVSRFDGDLEYAWEHRIADVRVLSPSLAIESVAAGGGSICDWTATGLTVGPHSAGASPGPACYGAGGPLTITDCNLLLGRIDPLGFGLPVTVERAREALERLIDRIEEEGGERPDAEALAAGLIDIANERMADAIRGISVRKGYDPADYALVVFGGAGAQHGCGIARRLGIRTLIIPPGAGLLSAWGLGSATVERFAERQVLRALDGRSEWLRSMFDQLANQAISAVAEEGIPPDRIGVRRRIASLRFVGQESTLAIEVREGTSLRSAFLELYEAVYGHRPPRRAIEVESIRVVAAATNPGGEPPPIPVGAPSVTLERGVPDDRGRTPPADTARVWLGGGWMRVPRIARADLRPGGTVAGPALILDPHTAIVVEDGWSARVHGSGALVVTARAPAARHATGAAGPDETPRAVREELFNRRFEALVREMGEQLRRTALSTNITERLDFSCALLDAGGELVANAPHIPVHLGALGVCVRSVATSVEMRPGDVIVTNHPGFGGSHLPDVTLITPVHARDGELIGYVANRAHHAEIGGTRPGSMPPDARSLIEEGVVIPPTYLVRNGRADWRRIEALLARAPYPSRAIRDNLADLRAQLAANRLGATILARLAEVHGTETVREQMEALRARATTSARAALSRLGDATCEARESLDDGSTLQVRVTLSAGRATFDFAGTSPQHGGNLNATPAIVRSTVLYVLRLLIQEELPLNEGILRPVEIILPPSLLNPDFGVPPERAPAVVGGNTEVSQRLVDTLLKAFSIAACSQGTMNNVLWGSERFGFYETIAGGGGARPGLDGPDAVHTHMTNTRITDVEILEHRYPARVDRFSVRRGSGGRGRFRGGDGVVRELTFLAPVELSVLTQHRREGPYAMAGGEPGSPGAQKIVRSDGTEIPLGPVDGMRLEPGDRFIIETPGGGGWGPPE